MHSNLSHDHEGGTLLDLGYEEMLSIANVPRLGEIRLHLKLAHVFKIVHGLCYFSKDIFTIQPHHLSRLSRSSEHSVLPIC